MDLNRNDIKKAIEQSQHCQRNWDLSKQIPQEDIDIIITAVTQCPSKQNIAHYRVHSITRRDIIEQIHEYTRGFTIRHVPSYQDETNSQVLANLLLVFEEIDINITNKVDANRNDQTQAVALNQFSTEELDIIQRDKLVSVGIASGYANIIANMLGYNTGYCACFDGPAVQKILGIENKIMLMLGIGFKNQDIDRKIHQVRRYVYPTKRKQEIKVNYYD